MGIRPAIFTCNTTHFETNGSRHASSRESIVSHSISPYTVAGSQVGIMFRFPASVERAYPVSERTTPELEMWVLTFVSRRNGAVFPVRMTRPCAQQQTPTLPSPFISPAYPYLHIFLLCFPPYFSNDAPSHSPHRHSEVQPVGCSALGLAA